MVIERWYFLGILAILLFGFGSFFGKVASIRDIPERVYFFEAVGTLTVFLTFFLYRKTQILEGFSVNYFALAMGLTWGLGTVFFILALENAKLSLVTPLTSLYPAVTVLLAYVFLAERLEPKELLGVVFAIFSIFLIVK